jgi:hypothetical protein
LSIVYWLLLRAKRSSCFGHAAVAAVRRNSLGVVVKTTKMPLFWGHPAALKTHHPLAGFFYLGVKRFETIFNADMLNEISLIKLTGGCRALRKL